MKLREAFRSGLAFEWIFAALIVASIVRTIWFTWTYGYLPPPYFYEPSDVYGDWFNTAYWARTDGMFDVWTTLYPPLSFVLLQFLGIDRCYPRSRAFDMSAGLIIRDCDWLGIVSIWSFWALSVVLVFLAMRKFDRSRAIPRTICVGFGWPLLNAIERGNLVLIAFPFFLLATMPLLKSARLRWLFAGMAINLKVYLIAPFVAQLFKRRWRWVEGVLLATIFTYLVSYTWLGHGTPAEIFRNLSSWSTLKIVNPLDFWPATTYQGLYSLLDSNAQVFPTLLILGSRMIEWGQLTITLILRATQAIVLAAMAASWLRPEVVSRYRLFTLGVLLALISTEAGGYSPCYFMALVMTERWKGPGAIFAICACYLLALSYDIRLSSMATVVRDSYIAGARVVIDMNLTLWPFVRPLLIQLIAIALSCATLRAVWLDVRHQGWAERWRFRRDVPFLPWVRRPSSPEQRSQA